MTLEVAPSVTQHDSAPSGTRARSWGPFALVTGLVVLALAGASVPTPLYTTYQADWHVSSLAVTEIYATYAVGVLVALVLVGGVSDIVGRRPVLLVALTALVADAALFALADGLEWLFAARALQGAATGLLLGATGAALVDLHPRGDGAHAGLVNGIASAIGLGSGAAISSVLVERAPAPETTPYLVFGALMVVALALTLRLPEPVTRRGTFRLRPSAPGVPRHLRRTFVLSSLAVIASWSVCGLYLSLGPSVVNRLLDTTDHMAAGGFVLLVCASGALAQWLLRAASTRTAVVLGAALLAVGSAASSLGIATSSTALFIAGSVVLGLGFGTAFMGALRSLTAQLPVDHRARVMSAFFVVAYASISVPTIAAGIAVDHVGLDTTVEWFGAAVALLAAVVAVTGWYELRPRFTAAPA